MGQGILITFITLGICGLAFYFYHKNRITASLTCILFLGFFLRVFCSLDPYLHEWDERFHALVAKNLIEDPLKPTLYKTPLLEYNYQEWISNHVWLHKQPLPLWSIALSLKTFGVNEFAVRIPSIILSTLCILFTFLIGKKMFNDRVGLWAAFLLAVNGLVLEITSGRVATDHIDLFFMFFIELGILLSIYFSESKRKILLFLIGASIGAAILCKWLPALIVLPIFFVLNFDRSQLLFLLKELTWIVISIIVVVLPWQIYAAQQFPLEYWWEQYYNVLHITEGVGVFSRPWWYFIDMARMVWNEMIYIAIVWYIWKMYQEEKKQNLLVIFIWIVIPYLFFSFVTTKMQGYVLFTAPAIFLVLGLFLEDILVLAKKSNNKLKLFYKFVMVLTVFFSLRYGIERVKPFEENNIPKWAERLEDLEKEIINQEKEIIIVNEPKYVEAMFMYECIAYRALPSNEQLTAWQEEGYLILIRENENYKKFKK